MPVQSLIPVQPNPLAVSTLLDFREVNRHAWAAEELAAMSRHQLAAPLQLSLGVLSGEVAHQLRVADPPVNPLMTLGQLFEHEHPPIELLKLVKRFAKICKRDPNNPLPSEIVMLLYYGSIAAAMTRTSERITDLPAAPLRRGMNWMSNQPWVTEQMRGQLREAIAQLDRERDSAGPAGVAPQS
jgi:hypothetical protein